MANMTDLAPTELGRFLRARREGVRPADVGLPAATGSRRTPGLRREEPATLAGVSIDYYTRLERSRETRPSPAVVDALARALLLDAEEHEYLRSLAAVAARRAPQPPAPPPRSVRGTVRLLLETVRPNPAYVLSRTYDVLAANPGGALLHPGLAEWPARQRNTIRYTFLHPAARELFPDWEQKARGCVAQLRAVAGSDPDAPTWPPSSVSCWSRAPTSAACGDATRCGGRPRPEGLPASGRWHADARPRDPRREPRRRPAHGRLHGAAGHPRPRRDAPARPRGHHRSRPVGMKKISHDHLR